MVVLSFDMDSPSFILSFATCSFSVKIEHINNILWLKRKKRQW